MNAPRSLCFDAYVAGGGNFIDSADVYSRWAPGHTGGESEAVLGQWMHERGNRVEIVVATKAGSAMGNGPNERGLSRVHIMNAVEASLRRLQTDYIDLYQAHVDDRDTPLEEALGIARLRRPHPAGQGALYRRVQLHRVAAGKRPSGQATRTATRATRRSSHATTSPRGTSTSANWSRSARSRGSASSPTRRSPVASSPVNTAQASRYRQRHARRASRRGT